MSDRVEEVDPALDNLSGQNGWTSLGRGPTQNAAYAIGGTFVVVWSIGLVMRAFKGLPFDEELLAFLTKSLLGVGSFVALVTLYLKSWRIWYNQDAIVTQRFATLKSAAVRYPLKDMTAISCFFSRSVTLFGLPFDTLVFEFQGNRLVLRTSDWKRESLKQLVCDLMSYRNDLPRDPRLLDYIAGGYDDIFIEHG